MLHLAGELMILVVFYIVAVIAQVRLVLSILELPPSRGGAIKKNRVVFKTGERQARRFKKI